jgi:cysteine-rich repeat protein
MTRWLALVLIVAVACGDDAASERDAQTLAGLDGGFDEEDGGIVDTCDGAHEGARCGDDRHCIAERCLHNRCGDGVAAFGEACDDGNDALGDACDPACRVVPLFCGDGNIDPDEECDDGNLYDLDTCSTACTENLCGNARIDGREECDDGNLADDDKCTTQCLERRCRNGRVDLGEECDDGNRIHDDGCTNACTIQICGNQRVEGAEECDDGNDVESDACDTVCQANVCGNGRVDPGEVCDGSTVEYGCATDCKSKTDNVCRACEEAACSNYQSQLDLVAGCFNAMPDDTLVPIVDPQFSQDCIDAVDCARRTGCGFDVASPAVDCYCGSRGIDECIEKGPASDAPCVPEWQAATRVSSPGLVLAAIADLAVPAGWATYMLICDAEECASECVP